MGYASPEPVEFVGDRLRDRVIFVTGATSGIGQAAVKRFSAEGALVVAAARRIDKAKALAEELSSQGHQVSAVRCDVRDEASVKAAIDFTIDTYGRLDGALDAAGIRGPHRLLHELDVDDFDEVVATNLRGTFLCLKHEVNAILAGGNPGSIVTVSAVGGLIGAPDSPDHGASKWGMAGLIKCAALAYARQGIRINAIAPGPTRSEEFDSRFDTEESRIELAARFPMNYIAQPDDMARAALYLLSDESRWTTGAVIPCEGGYSVGQTTTSSRESAAVSWDNRRR